MRPRTPLEAGRTRLMPVDLINAPSIGMRAKAARLLLACPSDLCAYGRLDADGAVLLIVETRELGADAIPLSTVSVSWNRYRGEAVSCATGEINAPPAHIEFAKRAHTGLMLALALRPLGLSPRVAGSWVCSWPLDGWGLG